MRPLIATLTVRRRARWACDRLRAGRAQPIEAARSPRPRASTHHRAAVLPRVLRQEFVATAAPRTNRQLQEGARACNCSVEQHQCALPVQLSDYPTRAQFMEALPRHYEEFIRRLPLGRYTLPSESYSFMRARHDATLCTHNDDTYNLVRHLSAAHVPPDLGPKMYTANGSCTLAATPARSLIRPQACCSSWTASPRRYTATSRARSTSCSTSHCPAT